MSQKGFDRCSCLLSGIVKRYDGRLHRAKPCGGSGYGQFSVFQIGAKRKRCLSSEASVAEARRESALSVADERNSRQGPLAKKRQVEKEFFADLLSSAATSRDAKAYLNRLKPPKNAPSTAGTSKPTSVPKLFSRPEVNVGNLYGRARAVDESPIFAQYADVGAEPSQETATIHVALVKIVHPETLDDERVRGIAQTLSQLSRLSMAPCVILDPNSPGDSESEASQKAVQQTERFAAAVDALHDPGSRILDNAFTTYDTQRPEVFLRKLLIRPLQLEQIPIIVPKAYSNKTHCNRRISANDAILALAREFAGLNSRPLPEDDPSLVADQFKALQKQISLDRIILVDAIGGIPSPSELDRTQVFVNLEQEYSNLRRELSAIPDANSPKRHKANLLLLREVLSLLPSTSSGLITTPAEASNSTQARQKDSTVSGVGTRKQKNPLIHNLLTDKPAYSSSLPSGRLGRTAAPADSLPMMSTTTFVKRGLPLIILPNPTDSAWTADNHGQPRLKLTDPRIDLPRLVHLIDDSFDRKLDVEKYLKRVNDKIAGVIIAGEYEGGALLTWETPPGAADNDTARLVPYLDKFAVLKRSQGAGGVADILFNAMVRTCFPNGVCWRSRKDNPVNKWYFERSRGTWKIPETNWTMFWTTPGVVEQGKTFLDYEGVCRGVMPTWADKKKVID